VPQDFVEAVRWYRKAPEQGDASAQSNLGLMYSVGQGVPQDDIEGMKWYILAAMSSSPGADRDLATKSHDNFAKNLKPDQIAKAQRLAREWTVKFAAPKK